MKFDLASIPVFELLSEPEIELLNKNSNLVTYHSGEVIFRQNTLTSHIMILRNGLVKVYKDTSNQKRLIIKLIKPNNFFGLLSVFGERIYQYSASTVERAEIIHIDNEVFVSLLEKNGKFAQHITNLISKDGLYILERLMTQYQKQLPGRIADVILYFSQYIYKNHTFDLPLTRKELAEFAGTTKESFIRTLTEFKNDRIIHLDGRRVQIQSMEVLRTLSKLG